MSTYVTKELIRNEMIDGLDLILQDNFGFNNLDDNNSFFVNIEDKKLIHTNSEPIEIDGLIQILKDFKESGANYVQINDNCDHYGYDFTAFNIRLSTEEEITNFELKLKEYKERMKQIQELENKLRGLYNQK